MGAGSKAGEEELLPREKPEKIIILKERERNNPAHVVTPSPNFCLNSDFWLNQLRIWGSSLNSKDALLHHHWHCRDLSQNAAKTIEKDFSLSELQR